MRHRKPLGAGIGRVTHAPEGARTGLGLRPRRVTGANAGLGPPERGLVATVDRLNAAGWFAPIAAAAAGHQLIGRAGHDEFAASLPTMRGRPMRDPFRFSNGFRRSPQTKAFAGPRHFPEHALVASLHLARPPQQSLDDYYATITWPPLAGSRRPDPGPASRERRHWDKAAGPAPAPVRSSRRPAPA